MKAKLEIDNVKMLRETLCVAQSTIARSNIQELSKDAHIKRLSKLIDQCDIHRPVGSDGKHGNLHTDTCGCEDK